MLHVGRTPHSHITRLAMSKHSGSSAVTPGRAQCRTRLPGQLGPALIMLLAGLPHSPVSIRLHLTIGVSEDVRDFWRTVDVLFIFACAGATLHVPPLAPWPCHSACSDALLVQHTAQAGGTEAVPRSLLLACSRVAAGLPRLQSVGQRKLNIRYCVLCSAQGCSIGLVCV